LRPVVLVPHVDLGACRRDGGHEDVDDAKTLDRGLQVRDVALDGSSLVADRAYADGPGSDRRPEGAVAAVEEYVGRLQRIRVELGEAILVAAAKRRALVLFAPDAVEALGHVPLPDRLSELAVVDDVGPGLDLPAHDVGDSVPQLLLRSLPEKCRLRLGRSLKG